MADEKLRFFLLTDNVETKSKDKAYLNTMKKVIESNGHSAKVVGVGSNLHTQAKQNGCKNRNDVWVCVVGGVCSGTLKDMSSKYAVANRGKAYLVWAMRTDYIKFNLETTKYLPRAWDDNFSPKSFKGLKNPVKYMNKHNIGRVYGANATEMATNLVNNNIGHPHGQTGNVGVIFSDWGDGGTVDTNASGDKSETQSYGFDTGQPFSCYIKILFSVDDPQGKKETCYIDFTANAPQKGHSYSNEDLYFVNNEFRENRINILEKLEQRYNGKHKFYIREIWLEDHIPTPNKLTTGEDKTKSTDLYDSKNDFSSYKMLLSECGFTNMEAVSSVNLGLSGKSLLDGVKECVEKTDFLYKIRYGDYRYQDHLDFYKDEEYKDTKYEYSQGYNGNILAVNSVTYAPLNTLRNNSIVVFKTQIDEDDEKSVKYQYSQSRIPTSVLRYGEFTTIQSASDSISPFEAYFDARTSKEYAENMDIAYSITVEGYDGIEIMDWAKTFMNRKFYNDVKRVNSIEVNGDVTKRPMVRTTLGLGAIDKKMRVQKNLREQRKNIKKQSVEVTGGITFNTDTSFWED